MDMTFAEMAERWPAQAALARQEWLANQATYDAMGLSLDDVARSRLVDEGLLRLTPS